MLDAKNHLFSETIENQALLFNTMLQNVPYYIFWQNLAGVYLGCNQRYTELIGYQSSQDIIGKTNRDLPFLADKSRFMLSEQAEKSLLSGKKMIRKEQWLRLINGEKLLWEINQFPILDKNKSLIGIFTLGIDVTERVLERERIKSKNEDDFHNFEYILSHLPAYVYWKNTHSEYMGCNHNLAKISHLSKPADIIGKTDHDFDWGRETADQFIQDDKTIMRTGKSLTSEYELPFEKSDGHRLFVRTDKLPFYNKKGKVIGILGVAIDITAEKILEAQLQEEQAKAQIANKIKTEFVRNMEHDLRTPFSGVWGLTSMLWEQETDESKKELLGHITHCAKELLDYCNDILDFTKTESGSLPMLSKKFDLKALLNSIMKMHQPTAIHKKLALHLTCDPHLPPILIGDPHRLSRILINLMSNALKFTATGQIDLQVAQLNSTENKERIIRFTLKDTGIGFPLDKKEYIYEKFTRLLPSNREKYKGLGLGLRIVKQFIDEMEGEIEVSSEPEKGTTFYCTFPFRLPLTQDLMGD